MSSNPDLHNYKLLIVYDGTNYCGWQVQPNGLSIQQVVQEKASLILRQPILITGSGRTDAGVHAKGQAAHFQLPRALDLYRFLGSLNALLPSDIRVLEAKEVPMNFHARYSATGKIYHYHLHLDYIENPFTRLYCWRIKEKMDLAAFKKAATCFIGSHDFTSLSNDSHSGCAANDPVRTVQRLDIIEQPQGLRLEFEANGFLYKMVRNITGTLVDVGLGKFAAEQMPLILAARDRKKAGRAAPPQGLFLMHVHYPNL
jgi:tRNA pseudouridine38-40 synthase